MKSLLEKLFPKDEPAGSSNRLVQRGLEALRLVRDSRAVSMGNVRRTPSHYELRIASGLYDELSDIDALNDLAFHLKDELMKDLASEKGQTFGDHTIHVRIAQDSSLAENEIYAVVRNPERGAKQDGSAAGQKSADPVRSDRPRRPAPDEEATRVLGLGATTDDGDEDRTMVLGTQTPPQLGTLRVNRPDGSREGLPLSSERFVVGRAGESGRGIPEGFDKIALDLPKTVSREQIAVTLDADGWLVERIGNGGVSFIDGTSLEPGASRRLSYTDPVILDGVALRVERTS